MATRTVFGSLLSTFKAPDRMQAREGRELDRALFTKVVHSETKIRQFAIKDLRRESGRSKMQCITS